MGCRERTTQSPDRASEFPHARRSPKGCVGGSRNAPLALEPRLNEVKPVCKPGSVQGRTPAAVIPLGRRLPAGSSDLPGSSASHAIAPLFGLAPDGVCQPLVLPQARCALTAPFHPCLCLAAIGGVFSVALSIASRRPAVSRHPALRSPDFPPPLRRVAATARPTSQERA